MFLILMVVFLWLFIVGADESRRRNQRDNQLNQNDAQREKR